MSRCLLTVALLSVLCLVIVGCVEPVVVPFAAAPIERSDILFRGDEALTLVGSPVAVGARAPVFTALDENLRPVSLSDFEGKVIVIASVPSLDTPVCRSEACTLMERADVFGPDVRFVIVSRDLPFAIKRWRETVDSNYVVTLSDQRDGEFGSRYGMYIKELGVLARSITVIGRDGYVEYQQVVESLSLEPDYDAAGKAIIEALVFPEM